MEKAQFCPCSPSSPSRQDQLIPGLLNGVVLDCLLPRVPWHTRAILTMTSKAWKHALQDPHKYSELTRDAQAEKMQKAFVLVHDVSEEASFDCCKKMNTKRHIPRPLAISVLEEATMQRATKPDQDPLQNTCGIDGIWTRTKLPPIPAFAPLRILHLCGIVCLHGKIFVMGGWEPFTNAICGDVYMLDIAAGLWEWEAMPPMHFPRAFFHCVAMASKIYIVGGTSSTYSEEFNPEFFDAHTRTWELLPRVSVSRIFHFNGLSICKEGNFVLVRGFYTTSKRGQFIGFQRAYDPVSGMWIDCECVDDGGGDTVIRFETKRGGVASKCNKSGGLIMNKRSECVVAQQTRYAIVSLMAM